jgi:hypothetical protein
MDTLLEKVKANLIITHDADDALIARYLSQRQPTMQKPSKMYPKVHTAKAKSLPLQSKPLLYYHPIFMKAETGLPGDSLAIAFRQAN